MDPQGIQYIFIMRYCSEQTTTEPFQKIKGEKSQNIPDSVSCCSQRSISFDLFPFKFASLCHFVAHCASNKFPHYTNLTTNANLWNKFRTDFTAFLTFILTLFPI